VKSNAEELGCRTNHFRDPRVENEGIKFKYIWPLLWTPAGGN
jgi:hypothetical protein